MKKRKVLDRLADAYVVPALNKVGEYSKPSVGIGALATRTITKGAVQRVSKDVFLQAAKGVGKASAIGAVADGSLAAFRGYAMVKKGDIDYPLYARHIAHEAGCGLASSGAGALGTAAATIIAGPATGGAIPLIVGLGAAISTRRFYRGVLKDPLATTQEEGGDEEGMPGAPEGERDIEKILKEIDYLLGDGE